MFSLHTHLPHLCVQSLTSLPKLLSFLNTIFCALSLSPFGQKYLLASIYGRTNSRHCVLTGHVMEWVNMLWKKLLMKTDCLVYKYLNGYYCIYTL